jgi:hypothetical protein
MEEAKNIPLATFNPEIPVEGFKMNTLASLKEDGLKFHDGFHHVT